MNARPADAAPPPEPVFDDGKDPAALRTIGEVSQALGIRQHVLRYWEDQFPALKPIKRSAGHRYYRPEDIALIRRIDRLVHGQGFTLKGAKQALAQAGSDADGQSAAGADAGALAFELRAIRDGLARALAAS